MNKKFLYAGSVVVVLVILYFIFGGSTKIKNYPSEGADIVAFGDSLIFGVGATSDSTNFVSILSRRIGKPIVNLGVSGNTTADGLSRLNQLDKYKPKVVILLLGGNDYLRKVPIDTTFTNLEKIIKNIQSRGAVVLLLGVRGGIINDKFDERFEELAEKTQSAYVSNVLDGLITKNEYMADAIHPNDTGYAKIAARVYPVLYKLAE